MKDLPLYKPQDKLKFRGRVAYVIECINLDKRGNTDYRYYVDSAGIRWSLTESILEEENLPKFIAATS